MEIKAVPSWSSASLCFFLLWLFKFSATGAALCLLWLPRMLGVRFVWPSWPGPTMGRKRLSTTSLSTTSLSTISLSTTSLFISSYTSLSMGVKFVWPGWPGPTMGRKGFCSSCLPPSKSSTHNTHLTRWPKHFDCISQKKPTHKFLSCHDDMTQHSFTDHQTSAQSIFSPWNTETTSEHESGYYEQNENLIFNSFVFLDSWMISIVDRNDIIRSGSWGRALERV